MDHHKKIIEKLFLNEIFLAEKDASKTSSYRLFTDGEDLGKFRSSGIIVSSGTGSSGWLYGAKRITGNEVKEISKQILIH